MKWYERIGMWGIAAILAILVITADLSLATVGGVVLTVALVLSTLLYFSMNAKSKKVFDRGDAQTNRSVDVSAENRVPPPALGLAIVTLIDLGFRRLGEEATVRADGSELGCEWVFIGADGHTLANLCPVRAMPDGYLSSFQSIYPGADWLLTYYPSGFPMGETITEPGLRMRHTRESLLAAFDLHQRELQNAVQPPVEIREMADYMAYIPAFRERHLARTLRRGEQIVAFMPYFWAGAALVALLGTALSFAAPRVAAVLFTLGLSGAAFFMSYLIASYPRPVRLYRLGIALLLLLLPLDYLWPIFSLVHLALLAGLLLLFIHFMPREAKALADEIQAGKTDIDWQA